MTRIAVPLRVAATAASLLALAPPALAQRAFLPLPPMPPATAPATNSSGATLPMAGPSIDPLAVPLSAPPPPVLPPPTVVPVRAERPPPPATVAADAPGAATAIAHVLIHGGVASPDITVLALGAAPPGANPDRVDITMMEPK
jgi:hypothetical protein